MRTPGNKGRRPDWHDDELDDTPVQVESYDEDDDESIGVTWSLMGTWLLVVVCVVVPLVYMLHSWVVLDDSELSHSLHAPHSRTRHIGLEAGHVPLPPEDLGSIIDVKNPLPDVLPDDAEGAQVIEKFLQTIQEQYVIERDQFTDVLHVNVIWEAYCGCHGFLVESVNFLLPLQRRVARLKVILESTDCLCPGYSDEVVAAIDKMIHSPGREIEESTFPSIWISHHTPDMYPAFPSTLIYQSMGVTNLFKPDLLVGRSMFEIDRIPSVWVNSCNREEVNEVWVPSRFLLDVFTKSGVDRRKVKALPESIDAERFHTPEALNASSMPSVFPNSEKDGDRCAFKFLSVFKWEERKGWDLLVDTFLRRFSREDGACLYLQTYVPGVQSEDRGLLDITQAVEDIRVRVKHIKASQHRQPGLKKNFSNSNLAKIYIMTSTLPEYNMTQMYLQADAFVLPTRGEGWGLPIIEAMAAGLPTIATNWSSPVDFLTTENAFPVKVAKLERPTQHELLERLTDEEVELARWALPDVEHLGDMMEYVLRNREEAQAVGRQASDDIRRKFSLEPVADRLVELIAELTSGFLSTRKDDIRWVRRQVRYAHLRTLRTWHIDA